MLRIRNLFLIPFAVAAFVAGVFTTRFGIGVTPDSVFYIAAARTLASQHEFSVPLTSYQHQGDYAPLIHFPPLYPFLLAIFSWAGIDPLSVARGMAVLLFTLNTVLIGACILQTTQSRGLASLGAFLFLFLPDILQIHFMAWSEQLFLSSLLLFLHLCVKYFRHPVSKKIVWIGIASVLAVLTRHAGIVLVFSALIVPFLVPSPHKRRHFYFVSLICLLCVPWFLRNRIVEGRFTSSQFTYHAIFLEKVREGLTTISHWCLPSRWNEPWHGVLVLVAIFGIGFWISRSQRVLPEARVQLRFLILMKALFIVFLIVSFSFFYPSIPLDGRILAPVYVLSVIALCHAPTGFSTSRAVWKKIVFGFLLMVFIFFFGRRGISYAADIRGGQGYASETWRNSPSILRLRQMQPKIPIYSNGYDVIYLYTGKATKWLPEDERELPVLQNATEGKPSLFVFLDQVDRPSLPENLILERIPMRRISDLSDGGIYLKEE